MPTPPPQKKKSIVNEKQISIGNHGNFALQFDIIHFDWLHDVSDLSHD